MFIPNVNLTSYRMQFQTSNIEQVRQIICNENIHTPRYMGMQRALVGGIEDEGARYRGYGANSDLCNCENIYNPIYYNSKNSYQGNTDWFISDVMR